jgi:hypothetical protein
MRNVNIILDEHIPQFTRMVAERKAVAFLICGDPGVGKSFEVEKTLKEYTNLTWSVYGGDISPIGLYKTLYENKNGIIVFDDIDAVFSNKVAANILKNALNSKLERRVDYLKRNYELFDAHGLSEYDCHQIYLETKTYPNSFQYNGGCIFISNNELRNINSAVRDRSIAEIVVKLTNEEILQRIANIIEDISPELSLNTKYEVLSWLYEKSKMSNKKLSIRSFTKALVYRIEAPYNWKELINLYT